MFRFVSRKNNLQAVSEASIRYEIAVKEKAVFSLPFEAASRLSEVGQDGFLLAVNNACKSIAKELMLMRQIKLLDNAILSPRKFGSIWLPMIIDKPNPNNLLVTLDKLVGEKYVDDFTLLLKKLIKQPGVYEVVPGLALFGSNGGLHVTASKGFIANLNNE